MTETAPSEPLTVLEVLRRSTEFLKARGCDAPRLDAELILARALAVKRLDLYLQFDRPLVESELAVARELVRRRGTREPLAYLLGEKEFRSLAFEVTRDVLVPRPETELLVDEALARLATRATDGAGATRVADVGTGSGCIAVALAHARADLAVVATDISPAALAVAARNAARHGVAERIRFVEGAFLDALADDERFDLIASNPPYVLPSEEKSLPAELRHEPRGALFVPDGDLAAIYGPLARAAAQRLLPGGTLLVEIGEGQADAVEAEMTRAGLTGVAHLRDLAGTDRFVAARVR